MDDIEQLIEYLHSFYAALEKLRGMEGPEMLLDGRVEVYRQTLGDAYAAYNQVETVIDGLGQELEAQRARLDKGVRKYGP